LPPPAFGHRIHARDAAISIRNMIVLARTRTAVHQRAMLAPLRRSFGDKPRYRD
jgi:hypothetical protein